MVGCSPSATMENLESDSKMNIQKRDINTLLATVDRTKPITLVILDDSGLPSGESGKEYIKKILSNPEKLGKRCIVSSKCRNFIFSAAEALGDKIVFINNYLLNVNSNPQIDDTISIYILPDFSGKNLIKNSWKIFWHKFTKKLSLALASTGLVIIYAILECVISSDENVDKIANVIKLSETLAKQFSPIINGITVILACVACLMLLISVPRSLDKECTKCIRQQNDNVLFLFRKLNLWTSLCFWLRWICVNKLNQNNHAAYICSEDPPLREAFQFPQKVFQSKSEDVNGFRFLLALHEYWNTEKIINELKGYF